MEVFDSLNNKIGSNNIGMKSATQVALSQKMSKVKTLRGDWLKPNAIHLKKLFFSNLELRKRLLILYVLYSNEGLVVGGRNIEQVWKYIYTDKQYK